MTPSDPTPDPTPDPSPDLPAGLCKTCRYSRRIESARGSIFRLCERSMSDPRYPRYPALPVLRCDGFEPAVRADR